MLGPQCCSNPPTLNPASGGGDVEELAGFKTNVTGSLDSKLAVLLVSDVCGYEAPNLRKLADKVAAAGFYVVVPDFLYGDPYAPQKTDRPIGVWMTDHRPEKGAEDAKAVIAALKSKGMVVVKLASSDDIQVAVVLHPGPITEDEIYKVKVPIAILGAENDHKFPAETLKRLGEMSSTKSEFDSFVKIFLGVAHGWTVRYNVEDESAIKSAEEAHDDMSNWFAKYIK